MVWKNFQRFNINIFNIEKINSILEDKKISRKKELYVCIYFAWESKKFIHYSKHIINKIVLFRRWEMLWKNLDIKEW